MITKAVNKLHDRVTQGIAFQNWVSALNTFTHDTLKYNKKCPISKVPWRPSLATEEIIDL